MGLSKDNQILANLCKVDVIVSDVELFLERKVMMGQVAAAEALGLLNEVKWAADVFKQNVRSAVK